MLISKDSENLNRTVVIPNIETQSRKKFYVILFSCIAVAVVLAIGATLFFILPLRRILAGMSRMAEGSYDVKLEDADRDDEFGTLSKAFNRMITGLREKELLGRYVSSSVRRVITDAAFLKAAKEGMNREVTVLFSGLHEFEEFQKTRSPEETYQVMNRHLSVAAQAVEQLGGEISKIMEEKLMLVFDHEQSGGAAAAAEIALKVVREIRCGMVAEPLQPAIGVNSGNVIAGILGSADVRGDYTVIGDTVNLAARLATLAHIVGGTLVVVSGHTSELLAGKISLEKLPFKRVKGKTQEVEAFLLRE
jgi:class 3 adenylate cyclase